MCIICKIRERMAVAERDGETAAAALDAAARTANEAAAALDRAAAGSGNPDLTIAAAATRHAATQGTRAATDLRAGIAVAVTWGNRL